METTERTARPQIELHFPEKEIDNPSVFTTLCLAPETYRRIVEGSKNGNGYSILVVARNPADSVGMREIRDVWDPLIAGRIFTFSRPGRWEIGLLLFERTKRTNGQNTTDLLVRDLYQRFCMENDKNRKRSYGRYKSAMSNFESIVPTPYGMGGSDLRVNNASATQGFVIAKYVLFVSVPDTIFARKPSDFVWTFGNYFFKQPPYDQCDFRDRLLFTMIFPRFGFVPWLLWEVLKRILCFVPGVFLLLFMIKGSPRLLKSAFSPSAKLSLGGAFSEVGYALSRGDSLKDFLFGPFGREPYAWMFVPGIALIELCVIALISVALAYIVQFCMNHPYEILYGSLTLIGFVALAIALIFGITYTVSRLAPYFKKRAEEKAKKRAGTVKPIEIKPPTEGWWQRLERSMQARREARTIAYGQERAAIAERIAPTIVCGDVPKEVRLWAMPSGTTARGTFFAWLKSQVCRPYGF